MSFSKFQTVVPSAFLVLNHISSTLTRDNPSDISEFN